MDPAPPLFHDFGLQDNDVVMENAGFTSYSWPEYLAPYSMGEFSNFDEDPLGSFMTDITTEMDIENENKSTPTFYITSGAPPHLQPLTDNAPPFAQPFVPSVVPPSEQLFTSSSTPSLATPFVPSLLTSTQPPTPISTYARSPRSLEEVNLRVEKSGREDPPSKGSICIGSGMTDITNKMDIEDENKSTPTPTFTIPSGAPSDKPPTENALSFAQQFAPSVVPHPLDLLFTSSPTPSLAPRLVAPPRVAPPLVATPPAGPVDTSFVVSFLASTPSPTPASISARAAPPPTQTSISARAAPPQTSTSTSARSSRRLEEAAKQNPWMYFAPGSARNGVLVRYDLGEVKLQENPDGTGTITHDDGSSLCVIRANKGVSNCHHCKSRKTQVVFCTNVPSCRKTYCYACLDKYYDDHRHVSPECKNEICPACREGCSETISEGWDCPSCRNMCTCATCRRRSGVWHLLCYHLRDEKSYKFLTNQLRDGTYNPEIIVVLERPCQKSVMNALFTQLTITPIQTIKIGPRMERYLSALRSKTVRKLIWSRPRRFRRRNNFEDIVSLNVDAETILMLNLECLSLDCYDTYRGLPFRKLSFILENLTAPRFECRCSETKAHEIIELLQNNVFVVECLLRPKQVPTCSGDRIFIIPELVKIVSQNRAWQKKYNISCCDDFRRAFSASILEGNEEHTYVPGVLCALIASFLV